MKYTARLWTLVEHIEGLIFWAICMITWKVIQISPFIPLIISMGWVYIRWDRFSRRIKLAQAHYRLYPTKQNLYSTHMLRLEYAASIMVWMSIVFSWLVGAWSVQHLSWLYSLILTTLAPILVTLVGRYFSNRYVNKLAKQYIEERSHV